MKHLYLFALSFSLVFTGYAQTTFDRVYTILQTNCTGSCHTTATPSGGLDLSGNKASVYANLFNVTPVNAVASTAGQKRIDPGNPHNSSLFKKINQGLDANLMLGSGEGNAEPSGSPAMSQVEREMVRQWILYGARDTGTFVDETTISNFYVGQGGQPRSTTLAPPPANEGIQLYWGPMFVKVGQEIQSDINTYLHNQTAIDISKFVSTVNDESHHFGIFKFIPGHDTLFAKGMHAELNLGDAAGLWYHTTLVAQYPNNMVMDFPTGTGMVWDSGTVIKLSYHMINYNDSILMAEGYLNLYYTPHVPTTKPVITGQVIYHYPNATDLVILNNGLDTTFTTDQHHADSAFLWNIISIQGHTHKYGVDYNVWKRNANGTKGDIIYDGSYDPTYTFNQGVYVWDAAPYRKFDPVIQVDMRDGMIHEATYRNNTDHTIGFGITTEDEMFITFIMYYKSDLISGIGETLYADKNLNIYPNPVNDVAYIKLNTDEEIKNAELVVFDLLGNKVANITNVADRNFTLSLKNIANGTYLYKLLNNGAASGTGKIVIQH